MESCIHCVEKHLGRARGLYEEARAGYPGRIGMALGEMSLAEDEARERFPALAAQIRAQRKVAEVQRDYAVPFESLLKQVELTMASPAAAGPRKTAPGDCVGCGGASFVGMASPGGAIGVRSLRKAVSQREAPAPQVQAAPSEVSNAATGAEEDADGVPSGRPAAGPQMLVLLTAFNDFIASYSLVSVVLDQARAAVRAGFRVIVVGVEGIEPPERYREDPHLRHVEFRGVVPRITWREDEVDEEAVSRLLPPLVGFLKSIGEVPVVVLTHDLIFQSWYTTFAKALHLIDAHLDEDTRPRWYHQMHSSVGERPPEEIAQWRATIPEGHRMVVPNWSDVVHMQRYYQYDGEVVILPNIRDYRTFLGLTPRARYIADTFAPHLADVCQVYALSAPRAEAKGLPKVIETFAALKRQGASVCLIVAEAHATCDGAKASREMAALATSAGLVVGNEYIPTSQVFPQRAAYGLSAADVRGLLQLSNVFAFPSTSEACGLVMLEAAMCGALLVLNRSLAQIQDFIPPHAALWVDWGGARQDGDRRPDRAVADEVAGQILAELASNRVLAARERVLRQFSSERLARTMAGLWMKSQ